MNKIYQYTMSIGVLALIIWMFIYHSSWGKSVRNKQIYSDIEQSCYADVLDSVGYDKRDHNSPKLFLHGQRRIDLSFISNAAEISRKCNPGDSIFKAKGKMEIEVFSSSGQKVIPLKVHQIR